MNDTIVKVYNKIFDNDIVRNISLTLLLFFAGLIYSRQHLVMLNIPFIDKIIIVIFGVLFLINIIVVIINHFHSMRSFYEMNRYWIPLLAIILIKYFILFSQLLYSLVINREYYDGQIFRIIMDYPIYSHIKNVIKFIINFAMIFILTERINNFSKLNLSINAFGFGCVSAPIIGLLFFSDLIGKRIINVNGVYFSGSFWNASVIAFISSAWLLIGNLHNKKNKLMKLINIFMAIIMFIGGIAGLSRAIVVSGFISILIYLICLKDIKKLFKIVVIVIIVILIVQFQFGFILENFKTRLERKGKIWNDGRIDIWKDYIEDIQSFFILGEPIEGNKIFSKTGQGPHSVLLNWWSQFGIFAAIAFIWLMWGILKSASNIYNNLSIEQGAAVYAWLFAYLSLAMINETGYRELPFYTAIGIIFAWGNLATNKLIMLKE